MSDTSAGALYVGVDGCKAGWFSIGFDAQRRAKSAVFATFGELVDHYLAAELILVDIPIGLPEGPDGRACDPKARRLLENPARKSSVFPVPTRQSAHQARREPKDRVAAAVIELEIAGKSLNAQTFNISSKIAEVDEIMRARNRNEQPKIREVHPELLFWALNGSSAMKANKKKVAGREERLRVLNRVEPSSQVLYENACLKYPRKQVARDDILDAMAAAVTARAGEAQLTTLPASSPKDPKGLPMEMVYWLPD